jgi:hypothetical protein
VRVRPIETVLPKNMKGVALDGSFELLKPERQPALVRAILSSPWQLDQSARHCLEPLSKERTIMEFEQPVGDVDTEIRVDPDQLGVEGGMVDLGQRQAMRDHRLS